MIKRIKQAAVYKGGIWATRNTSYVYDCIVLSVETGIDLGYSSRKKSKCEVGYIEECPTEGLCWKKADEQLNRP